MNSTKTTKRALLSSVLAMLICVAMLIGTTFAWFTDSASTAVNKIQAGTLDIELQYQKADGSWEDAEGKILDFKKPSGHENESILWEPGCTYELPAIRILNKGNLALKYKLAITGIKGDAKLNEAIVWTNGTNELLSQYEGTMIPGQNDNVTESIVIKGHMKEDAGNEYQGLSIDGIGITVIATQFNSEYDSFGNTYDENAPYCEWPVFINQAVKKDENGTITDQVLTKYVSEDIQAQVTVPAAAVDTNAEQITLTVEKTTAPANFTVAAGQDSKTYDVKVTGLAAGNTTPVKAKIFVGIGLDNVTLTHNSNDTFTDVGEANYTGADKTFYYDSINGYIYFATKTFSPFSATFDAPAGVSAAGTLKETYYTTVADAQAAANSGKEVFAYRDITAEETGKTEVGKGEQFDIPNVVVISANNTSSGYDTLTDAMAAATDGCTIKLNADATITSQTLPINADSIVFDLNNKTITSSGTWVIAKRNGGNYNYAPITATIKNGNYVLKNSSGRIRFEAGSTGHFEDVNFSTIDGKWYTALQTYADSTAINNYDFANCAFENCYTSFEGKSKAQYNVVFNGGSFKANNMANGAACIYIDDYLYGNLNVNGTTFDIKNTNNGGYCISVDTSLSSTSGGIMNVNLEKVTADTAGNAMPYYYNCSYYYNGGYYPNATINEIGTNVYRHNGKTVETTFKALTETKNSLVWTENAEAYQACYTEWKAYVAAAPSSYNNLNYYLVESNGYYFVGGQGSQFNLGTMTMEGDTVTQVKFSIFTFKTIGTTDISEELGDTDNTSVHIYTLK